MKLTAGQIKSLLKKREDERVEFKRAASDLPGYFLDYRERLSNETRWNDRVAAHDATWSGNIYDFFFKIHDRVTGDVKIPFKIAAAGITRIDDTPVHKALREVLANALIHADYHGRRGIVVEKHFRTITFSNPGTMRVSKSVAVAGGTSDARNSAIFNIFALVDIGERSGMGLANLHGLWKKYGYAEPKITESYDPDRTVIVVTTDDDTENDTVKHPQPRTRTTTPYNTRTSSVQHPHKKRRCRLGRVMGRIEFSYGPLNGPLSGLKSGPLSGPLNDVVTNLIAEISSVNRKDLVRRTGVSERTMTRSLCELERSGKIEHRSSKKTGGYYLAEGSGGSGKAI